MDTPSLNRRDVLKVSLVGTAAMALPFQAVVSASSASELDESKMPRPYAAPFRAPRVLAPVKSDDVPGNHYGTVPSDYTPEPGSPHYPGEPIVGGEYVGTDYYRITQSVTSASFIAGVQTTLWGYNGEVPGPTIRVSQNGGQPRRVVMQQINELPAKHPTLGYVPWTSTHLHGSPSKPQFDGYAGDLTNPGEWKTYMYPNNCTPRTLWYHDHGVHHTAQNVYMGLAAQYHIVDEVLEEELGIPRYNPALSTYDIDQYEVPIILGDVMFAENGQLMWDDDGESGVYGDVILVNGVPWPNMKVRPRKYRFRILNGSLARGYKLRLSNGKPFTIIATDGGFMHEPKTVTQFTIGMAERYEIIVDFAGYADGTKIQLLNSGVDNARDFDHTGKIMQFQVDGAGTWKGRTDDNGPLNLERFGQIKHPVMSLDPAQSVATRHMELERSNGLWVINDQTWDDVVRSNYERVFAKVEPNSVEIWDLENSSGGWFHPLHVHLVDFQVLSRNGMPPRPEEMGPKDVVYVGEGETIRVLMRFDHEVGRYMIHCHNLSHEDHDMMVQYQVGDHDIDCDSINSCPPKSGEPDDFLDAYPPVVPETPTEPTDPPADDLEPVPPAEEEVEEVPVPTTPTTTTPAPTTTTAPKPRRRSTTTTAPTTTAPTTTAPTTTTTAPRRRGR